MCWSSNFVTNLGEGSVDDSCILIPHLEISQYAKVCCELRVTDIK